LSEDELRKMAKKMGMSAREMIRAKESLFGELKLEGASEDKLFKAMAKHPILMNRPIVDTGSKARLCRPPETVEELL
jgi:arsenate reductase